MSNHKQPIIIYQISTLTKLICAFIFSVILSTNCYAHEPESTHFKIIRLTDGVYAAIHSIGGQAICNAGIVDLGDKTIVFDTFLSLKAAMDLKMIADEITSHPVNYLIDSHTHNDHIRGNQVFKPKSSIISTSATRTDIANNEPNQIKQEADYAPKSLAKLEKDIQFATDKTQLRELNMWLGYYQAIVESHPLQIVTLPDITFENSLTISGSTRRVELIELGGHTRSDIAMYLPEDKIVFTGDLVFIGCHPYLADGNTQTLLSSLKVLNDMDIEKVVPGHGPVGTKDDILRMMDYVEMAYNLSKIFMEKGKTIDEVSNIKIPEPFDSWYFPNFFTMNMKFLYKVVSNEINHIKQ